MKILIIIIGICFSIIGYSQTSFVDSVSVTEANELISGNKSIIIIDGRNSSMFCEGHLPCAINIDAFCDTISAIVDTLDKTKPYLVYCTTHNRADVLIELMAHKGFEQLYKMTEGFLVWKQAGLSIE